MAADLRSPIAVWGRSILKQKGQDPFMALTTAGFVHQQEIDSAVQRVESKFAQEVDHIRYSLGENWIGAPSIFFRLSCVTKPPGKKSS